MQFVRVDHVDDAAISRVRLCNTVYSDVFVTATVEDNQEAWLTAWQIVDNRIVKRGSEVFGFFVEDVDVSDVGVTKLGGSLTATATRQAGGYTKIHAWTVWGDGSITLAGEVPDLLVSATLGDVRQIRVQGLANDKIATVVKRWSNRLRVAVWRFDEAAGEIEFCDVKPAGPIQSVAPTGWRPLESWRLVTAALLTGGKLRLIHWKVTEQGQLTRLAHATTKGTVGAFDVFGFTGGASESVVISAVEEWDQRLKFIAWNVSESGPIERAPAPDGELTLQQKANVISLKEPVVAFRNGDGDLELIQWSWGPHSLAHLDDTFEVLGDFVGGGITDVAVTIPAFMVPVTAVRMAGGFLRVHLWGMQPA